MIQLEKKTLSDDEDKSTIKSIKKKESIKNNKNSLIFIKQEK